MKALLVNAYRKFRAAQLQASKGKAKVEFLFCQGCKEAIDAKSQEERLQFESDAFANFVDGVVLGTVREDDHMSFKYNKAMQIIR